MPRPAAPNWVRRIGPTHNARRVATSPPTPDAAHPFRRAHAARFRKASRTCSAHFIHTQHRTPSLWMSCPGTSWTWLWTRPTVHTEAQRNPAGPMSALSYRCGAAGCAYQTAMLKNLQALSHTHKQSLSESCNWRVARDIGFIANSSVLSRRMLPPADSAALHL